MRELLAPAGDPNKLKLAFYYGADAVYFGGKQFSLRAAAENFTEAEIAEGVAYAHAHGKRAYVAANIFARNADLPALERYFRLLAEIGPDGVLVSDAGAFRLLKRTAPDLPVHISTQANNLNAETAAFWRDAGATRIVLARELSIDEIAAIHAAVPDLELEAFVHGAMCVSYSGRCYLSDYLDGRSSNRGECSQPCRLRYRIQAEGKEGWLDLEEDARGAYLLNSRDVNLIRSLSALAEAGVCSFKIEGRTKGEFYLATVVNAYRRALDGDVRAEELETLSHREYTGSGAQAYASSQKAGTRAFIALVKGCGGGRVHVEMRGRFREGDELEILSPSQNFLKKLSVTDLRDAAGAPVADAKLVQAEYSFLCPYPLERGDILRKRA